MGKISLEDSVKYHSLLNASGRRALTIVSPDKEGLRLFFDRGAEWQDYLIAGVRHFTAKIPDYELAHTILDADFISPEEVASARSTIAYTLEQIKTLTESLPSEANLKWCRDNGYAVVPSPPTAMSLLDIWDIQPVQFCLKEDRWFANQEFAREEKTLFGWLAIKKTPVANSTRKDWDEQNKLMSAFEYVPNAVEMSWFITTYFKVRGIELFRVDDICVRTSSLDSHGNHVYADFFEVNGLGTNFWYDNCGARRLGLSSGRKF